VAEFASSFRASYRLHPDKRTFERLRRRLVLEGFEGASLCLRGRQGKWRSGSTTMDEVMTAAPRGLKIPETARLGPWGFFLLRQPLAPHAQAATRKSGSARPQGTGAILDVHPDELHPWLKCDFALGRLIATTAWKRRQRSHSLCVGLYASSRSISTITPSSLIRPVACFSA